MPTISEYKLFTSGKLVFGLLMQLTQMELDILCHCSFLSEKRTESIYDNCTEISVSSKAMFFAVWMLIFVKRFRNLITCYRKYVMSVYFESICLHLACIDVFRSSRCWSKDVISTSSANFYVFKTLSFTIFIIIYDISMLIFSHT